MKIYSFYGVNEFIICCGYKGFLIKEYFSNYLLRNTNVRFSLNNNTTSIIDDTTENWTVECIDTGEETLTGGRLKRIKKFLNPDEPFLLTYGDGVGDINISQLIEFHRAQQKLVTVTAVSPPEKFGMLAINDKGDVIKFNEKPNKGNAWINGGFFVLQPEALDFITDDGIAWEQGPLQEIAAKEQLCAYKHDGFWQSMDTISEKKYLEELYLSDCAPWKLWD